VVIGGVNAHRLAPGPHRPEHLFDPGRVPLDGGVRHLEDRLGGAVVGLELVDLGPGEVLGKAEDVLEVGAPKAVDRLVGVPHRHQLGALGEKQLHEAKLGRVRVLVLVHVDEAGPGAYPLEHVRVGLKELDRPQKEVGKVHRAERAHSRFVSQKHVGEGPGPDPRHPVGKLGQRPLEALPRRTRLHPVDPGPDRGRPGLDPERR